MMRATGVFSAQSSVRRSALKSMILSAAIIIKHTAILALREDIKAKEVTVKFFKLALDKVRPSVTKEIEDSYKDLQETFRQARGRQVGKEKPSYYG